MIYKAYFVVPDSWSIVDNRLKSMKCKNSEVKNLANNQKELAICGSLYEAIMHQTEIFANTIPEHFSIPQEHRENAKEFAEKAEKFFDELVDAVDFEIKDIRISSGYRHKLYCGYIGGAMGGQHTTGEAYDAEDIGNKIDNWLLADFQKKQKESLLIKHDITIEHPNATNSWSHHQNRLPKSGNRIFYP